MKFGNTIITLETVDSTNNYAANLLRQPDVSEGTVVMSSFQSMGKGQRGAVWQSEPGANLLASLILRPRSMRAAQQFAINQFVCIGLVDYLKIAFELDAVIKWPNDILVNEQKLGGVLIECSIRGADIESVVVGMGINVNQQSFSGELNATSLRLLTGDVVDLKDLLNEMLHRLEKAYGLIDRRDELTRKYLDGLYGVNEDLYYREEDEVYQARISGIGPHGELQLQKSNGERVSRVFKQVELLGKFLR